jgi:CSN7 helical bundle subdomain
MLELGNSAARLEPFLLISKSAKGAAAAKLVQDATSAPGVFTFAELLDLPNIQEVCIRGTLARTNLIFGTCLKSFPLAHSMCLSSLYSSYFRSRHTKTIPVRLPRVCNTCVLLNDFYYRTSGFVPATKYSPSFQTEASYPRLFCHAATSSCRSW